VNVQPQYATKSLQSDVTITFSWCLMAQGSHLSGQQCTHLAFKNCKSRLLWIN